ncbi:MAG: ABC transporter ATP-binding protein [Bradymonadales bacterium]|nr:MAG: ABC transporter ATP-binding protein [Bradymonadales bacterium]
MGERSGLVIEAKNLSKRYRTEDGRELEVLRELSLRIESGEFVAIVGKSGSGKTTLLSLLAGLDQPSSGEVYLLGHRIDNLDEDALAPFRSKEIGFVFQSFHLIPTLSALENVMIPAQLAGQKDAEAKALELMRRVDLSDRVGSWPGQLSGGEQQRVAICRALINQPKIIFADEPTGNLDSEQGEKVLELLLDLRQNRSLVLVTHDEALAQRADRRLEILDGSMVDESTVARQPA